jgi:hypothetical protein
MDDLDRAYDLRHRSDHARREGRAVEALGDATEAVEIYAALPDRGWTWPMRCG